MLRSTRELGPQIFTLRGNARWTGVQVTLARHIAADSNQDSGAKPKFLRTQHRANDDVAARLETAVHPHLNPVPQTIAQ